MHISPYHISYVTCHFDYNSTSFFCFKHIYCIPNSSQVVAPVAANYPSTTGAPPAATSPFSWVPRQMLSGDAAEEEGDSDGDSERAEDDRGEADEAELVIDIPNE